MREWLVGKLCDVVCDSYAAENQQLHDEIERLLAAVYEAKNSLAATDQTNTAAYRILLRAADGPTTDGR